MNTRRAKARRVAGTMNKTEGAYDLHLRALRQAGRVEDFAFEAVTLKLAHDCRYTPDFMVIMADGTIEFHEVKGFWRDDAKVKVRVAADRFPWFRFMVVTRGGKGSPLWLAETFGPKDAAA